MKKCYTLTAALLTACMAFTGCGASQSAASSGTAESGAAADSAAQTGESAANGDLEDFTVVLDWYPNAVHAFLYDALEKGYFEDEGLNVNIVFPSNDNDALTLTAAGKADCGLYYMNDVIMSNANQDVPLRTIGTVVNSSLDIIASLKDKNINRPKDLEGKTLGYSGTEFGEAVVKYMMEQDGASIDNVDFINVGFDLMSSMTTGQVDATYGCFINHEIPQLEKEGFEMNYFKLSDYGVPDYYALSFVAGQDSLDKNPGKYKKFLNGCKKGFEDMKNDPDGTLQILLDNQDKANFELDPDVEKKSMEILLPMMESEDKPFLYQDPEVFQECASWLKEVGLIDKDVDVNEIIVDPLEDY